MDDAVIRPYIRLYYRGHTYRLLLNRRRGTTSACEKILRRFNHDRRDWRRYAVLLSDHLPVDFRDRDLYRNQEDSSARAIDRERATAEGCNFDRLA